MLTKKEMQKTTKNYYIELLRFIFCIIILLHHSGLVSPDGSGLLPSAGVFADAFFLITGYFACKHVEKLVSKPEKAIKYSLSYTIDKLKRVLPYSTFGVVIIYVLELLHLSSGTSLREHANRIYTMLVEILLLPMLGIMEVNLISLRNAPLWYLSAILIALPFVVFLAIKCNKLFKYCLVWLIPLLLEIWMVITYGGALPWMNRSPVFIYTGAIRGFSSIMLGCAVYYAASFLTSIIKKNQLWIKSLLTIAELVIFGFVVYKTACGIGGFMETVAIYLIAVMLVLTFSQMTYTADLQSKWFGILGSLSLPIYCMHWGVYRWVGTYLGMLPYVAKIVVTFILCTFASVIMMKLVELIKKAQKRNN